MDLLLNSEIFSNTKLSGQTVTEGKGMSATECSLMETLVTVWFERNLPMFADARKIKMAADATSEHIQNVLELNIKV